MALPEEPYPADFHFFFAIWDTVCYECHALIRVGLDISNQAPTKYFYGRDGWRESEPQWLLDFLKKEGVSLEFRKTDVVPSGYIANFCKECGATQGDWFLDRELSRIRTGAQDPPAIEPLPSSMVHDSSKVAVVEFTKEKVIRRFDSIAQADFFYTVYYHAQKE